MNRVKLSSLVFVTVTLCVHSRADAAAPVSETAFAAPHAFVAELTYLDANGDGAIDAREFAHGQQMASMILTLTWDACDRNQDGKLAPPEFQTAASEALRTLLSADSEADEQAEAALAKAVPMSMLLEQLGRDQAYADEIAALREALEELDDDTVVTHIISEPDHYPRLTPVVRTWVRYYPVRPGLRRHLRPHHKRDPKPAKPLRPHVRPKAAAGHGKPHAAKPHKSAKPRTPRPGARPRPGGRRP